MHFFWSRISAFALMTLLSTTSVFASSQKSATTPIPGSCACCSSCPYNPQGAAETEVLFILDRSGSMTELTQDTINGYNQFLEEQKTLPGAMWLTTVLFNHSYKVLYDHADLRTAKPLTTRQYQAEGTTALYDAIGKAITAMDCQQKKLTAEQIDTGKERVLVIIVTDGLENASREYSTSAIHTLISKREERGWEFIFMGANISSKTEAGKLGISSSNAMDFDADSQGLKKMYQSAQEAAINYRNTGNVGDWKQDESKNSVTPQPALPDPSIKK